MVVGTLIRKAERVDDLQDVRDKPTAAVGEGEGEADSVRTNDA